MSQTAPVSPTPPGAVLADDGDRVGIGPEAAVLRIIARSPVVVELDAPLLHIARVMADESIGVVVVRGPHEAAGIVSERDIIAALAAGADPRRERARDVMTSDLACVPVGMSVLSVANLMLDNEIRHVLVVTERDTVGVVSIRDVLMVLADACRAGNGA